MCVPSLTPPKHPALRTWCPPAANQLHQGMNVMTDRYHPKAIEIPPLGLGGFLTVLDGTDGIVVFAHGSGSTA
jgi:hypothetical protein